MLIFLEFSKDSEHFILYLMLWFGAGDFVLSSNLHHFKKGTKSLNNRSGTTGFAIIVIFPFIFNALKCSSSIHFLHLLCILSDLIALRFWRAQPVFDNFEACGYIHSSQQRRCDNDFRLVAEKYIKWEAYHLKVFCLPCQLLYRASVHTLLELYVHTVP